MTTYASKAVNIINSLSIGGAEKLLVRFAWDVAARVKKSISIIVLYTGHDVIDHYVERPLFVNCLNATKRFDLRIIPKLAREIRKGKYSIVHVHLFPAGLFVALASYFFIKNVHLIFTEHNVYNRRRQIPWFRLLDRVVYSRYEKIICVSSTVKRELLNWIPQLENKTIVINNGIPIPECTKRIPKKYDVIFVGRLTKAKGVDTLISSLALLKSKKVLKKTAIVGDGPLFHELKDKANKLGINDLVSFLGMREDVMKLLQQSRLFVSPSRWEGLPLSVLEAMAAGVPVIASNVGGIPEIIRNGVNGVLIRPEEPELLADAIHKLLKNQKIAVKLGQNARRTIKQEYAIERYSDKILELYDTLSAGVR